jgi:replicative DNA helicase
MTEGIHYSKEFEAAVLGICLLEKTAFGRTYGLIDESVFYYGDNRTVYLAMKEMWDNNVPMDALTVWERMMSQGIVLNAGNILWYFSELTRQVVSSAHLEYHCHVLKKFWQKRELETLTRSGVDPHGDQRQQAFEINQKINTILSSTEIKQDWYSMDELMFSLILHQQDIASGKKELIPTGFKAIDRLNGGFSPGQLIVIGARPSVGKSALMNKIAFAVSAKKKPVGIISSK